MATIRTRTTKSGRPSYTVVWRDPDLGFKSRTFAEKRRAEDLRDFLDANGNSYTLAAEAKQRASSHAPTVVDVVTKHIDALRGVTEGTIGNYRRQAELHLADTDLGDMPLDQVDRDAVVEWLDGITTRSGDPASWKTKSNLAGLVSAAFKRQVADGAMDRNPAEGALGADTSLPDRDPVLLSVEQLRALRDRVTPRRYALLLWVLTATGMRWQEATALRARDVEFTQEGRAIIHVRQALKRGARGHVVLGTTKTKQSRREISVDMALSEELAAKVRRLGPDDLLLTNRAGGQITSSPFHQYVWKPLIDRLVTDGTLTDRPWIREIRNAHCTHLLREGTPVHVVQKRLGHKSPQTTLGVYARMTHEDDVAAADAVAW